VRERFLGLEGKRLYLMRHGQTYEPRLDAPMASAEEDPGLSLTPAGREDVVATANAMAKLGLEAAFSSTFQRSLETARLIAEPHGLEVRTHPALEELRLHPEPGGTLRDVARKYLALARELAAREPGEVELECGRSVADVVAGAQDALAELLAGPARRVLVVAHGGLNRFLLTGFLGLPLHRFLALDQDFACVNVVEFVARGRPWVRALNVTFTDPFKASDLARR
jgi:alpha-ribazole phosphatase/probable phosphoglycerate mutase